MRRKRKNYSFWEKVSLEIEYRWQQIRHGYYNIKTFLYNCWFYAPMLWEDRDWDQVYIYKVLQHKLIKQRKCLVQHGHSVPAVIQHQNRTLTVCIELLDRLIHEERYTTALHEKHDAKWGEYAILREDESSPSGPYFFSPLFARERVITEKDKEQERREFMRICEHENYMIKQDLEYLTLMLRKHIQKWWD